jgi:adenylate cyclase
MPHLARANVMVLTGAIAAFVTHSIRTRQRRAVQLIGERQRVVDLFGQHVSQAVVDKLLAQDSELPSETRQVCILFFDIRNFTTFSETHSPAEVVDLLNKLFEPLVDVVDQYHGIINKFPGDGFMAVFGAPIDDKTVELNATRASLAILDQVDALRQAGEIPDIGVGIGLHAGPAMTGNVGSRGRKEYTIIGDTVNLAARIESLNKHFGSQLLVSDAVWPAAKQSLGPAVEAEAQEPVKVKGRNEPVVVWKLR